MNLTSQPPFYERKSKRTEHKHSRASRDTTFKMNFSAMYLYPEGGDSKFLRSLAVIKQAHTASHTKDVILRAGSRSYEQGSNYKPPQRTALHYVMHVGNTHIQGVSRL